MTSSPRPKLSLPSVTSEPERAVDLDVIDGLLPCRWFRISYKVAEVGRFSLTSEFLLRLLRSVDRLPETEAAAFFGFTSSELAYVVDELVEPGYVEQREGRLSLTEAGRDLFVGDAGEPQLYKVEARNERYAFDLVSLAPAAPARTDAFEQALPELRLPTAEHASAASKAVPGAFRRHFTDLVRRKGATPHSQSIYSVDDVTAADRFSAPTSLVVRARTIQIGSPEPDLGEQWTGYELDDRREIVEASAKLLGEVRQAPYFAGERAWSALADIAGPFLAEQTRDGRVRPERLYRQVLSRAGELRADRPTVPVLGTLFTDGNRDRLFEALKYALGPDGAPRPSLVHWLVPMRAHWGATRRLPQVLAGLRARLGDDGEVSSVAWSTDRAPWHLQRAFDAVIGCRAPEEGLGAFEALLVPGLVTAVSVHAVLGQTDSFPTALGIISFDPDVVRRTQELFCELLPPEMHNQGRWGPKGLADEIARSLVPAS